MKASVVILPAGLTCLRCEENPALPERIWCTVCAPIIDALPAEPIENGELEACISRHPAGKQRATVLVYRATAGNSHGASAYSLSVLQSIANNQLPVPGESLQHYAQRHLAVLQQIGYIEQVEVQA